MTITATVRQCDKNGIKEHEMGVDVDSEKRCGVKFNPTEDEDVRRIKIAMALAMSEINRVNLKAINANDSSDKLRCFATAKTQLEAAQMFAVKGVFQ